MMHVTSTHAYVLAYMYISTHDACTPLSYSAFIDVHASGCAWEDAMHARERMHACVWEDAIHARGGCHSCTWLTSC